MGILGAIGKAKDKFLTSNPVGKVITKSLDTLSAVVINPVTAITQGVPKAVEKYESQGRTERIVKTITNVGTAAAVVVGAGAVAGAARAGTLAPAAVNAAKTVGTAAIKNPVKTAVVAAAGPVVVGAVSKAPAKTAEAILDAPSKLVNVGQNVGTLINDPSLENTKKLFTDNPLIVGGAVAAATLAVGKGVLPAIATARQTSAINEQTEAIKEATFSTQPIQLVQSPSVSKVIEANPNVQQSPVTAQTQKASTKSSPKRRKRTRKATNAPTINQKVNVIVSNKSSSVGIRSSKRYINREVLPV